MAKPIVAIVGRPNVGKSTIFNKLTGQRLAIVEDTPGVTRDRIFWESDWNGRKFRLVDTGGIEPRIDDGLLGHMREQAQLAIDSADCIVMVTELSAGVTPQDQDVASMLMRSGKPVVLAVNKCDKVGEPPMELYDFYSLGLGELIPALGKDFVIQVLPESIDPFTIMTSAPGGFFVFGVMMAAATWLTTRPKKAKAAAPAEAVEGGNV